MELSELKDDIIIITTNSSSEDVPLIGEEVASLYRELSNIQPVLYNKLYFTILENNKWYEEHYTTSRYER